MLDHEAYTFMTQTYRLVLATAPEHIDAVKALRKEVLLEKYRHFASIEDEERFAWDESDAQAFIYLLQHQKSGRYVGTIRVFFINDATPLKEMPMEHYSHAPRIAELKAALPICEISRFALSAELPKEVEHSAQWVRIHLSLLLMIGTRITVQIYPFKMIFAIMEYSLARLLRWQHANFEQIGESVDYYGMRTPFAIEPHKLIEETKETEALSCYYLHQFSQPGGGLGQFLTQCPYIDAEMLSLDTCLPDRSLHT